MQVKWIDYTIYIYIFDPFSAFVKLKDGNVPPFRLRGAAPPAGRPAPAWTCILRQQSPRVMPRSADPPRPSPIERSRPFRSREPPFCSPPHRTNPTFRRRSGPAPARMKASCTVPSSPKTPLFTYHACPVYAVFRLPATESPQYFGFFAPPPRKNALKTLDKSAPHFV